VGDVEEGEREAAHALGQVAAGVLRPQPHRRLHLVVAATAGVHPGAELAEQPLDGRVDVLVGGVGLDLDGRKRGADLLGLLSRDQALAPEHARVRRRRLEVERQQSPVDLEGGGEVEDGGVEPAGQPSGPERGAHAGAASWAGWVDSAASDAAAHVFVGRDQTWMKPAAAPCWKLSACSYVARPWS